MNASPFKQSKFEYHISLPKFLDFHVDLWFHLKKWIFFANNSNFSHSQLFVVE